MSKEMGEKIAIKFTEELFGNVSGLTLPTPYKYYRWLINSTWVSSGKLYLYQLEFFNKGIKIPSNKILLMEASSRYSSSYDVNRLFDSNIPGTEWDANGSLPHYVKIELDEEITIDSFRWHTGTSSNKPKEFIFQGSKDGLIWENIYEDESTKINNWIEFDIVGRGNAEAFTLVGKERKHINGELIDGNYEVNFIERYPIPILWNMSNKEGVINNIQKCEDAFTLGYDENVHLPTELWDGTVSKDYMLCTNSDWQNRSQARSTNAIIVEEEKEYKFSSTGNRSSISWWDENNKLIRCDNFGSDNQREFILKAPIGATKVYYYFAWELSSAVPSVKATQFEYIEQGSLDFTVNITKDAILRYDTDIPESTRLSFEIFSSSWKQVSDGDYISKETSKIRASFFTRNNEITPILKNIWLEDANFRGDRILLNINPIKRFHNVEAELTVLYNEELGSLSGMGGKVESFEVEFTPIALIQKPNPYIAEHINIGNDIKAYFIKVDYRKRFTDETIKAYPNISVEFINVGEVNP